MHPYFQEMYFKKHALNTESNVKFDVEKMKKDNYEIEIERLIRWVLLLGCFWIVMEIVFHFKVLLLRRILSCLGDYGSRQFPKASLPVTAPPPPPPLSILLFCSPSLVPTFPRINMNYIV